MKAQTCRIYETSTVVRTGALRGRDRSFVCSFPASASNWEPRKWPELSEETYLLINTVLASKLKKGGLLQSSGFMIILIALSPLLPQSTSLSSTATNARVEFYDALVDALVLSINVSGAVILVLLDSFSVILPPTSLLPTSTTLGVNVSDNPVASTSFFLVRNCC